MKTSKAIETSEYAKTALRCTQPEKAITLIIDPRRGIYRIQIYISLCISLSKVEKQLIYKPNYSKSKFFAKKVLTENWFFGKVKTETNHLKVLFLSTVNSYTTLTKNFEKEQLLI